MSEKQNGEPEYIPSPEEIAAACREIQASWTYHEERMRILGRGNSEGRKRSPSPRVVPVKGG